MCFQLFSDIKKNIINSLSNTNLSYIQNQIWINMNQVNKPTFLDYFCFIVNIIIFYYFGNLLDMCSFLHCLYMHWKYGIAFQTLYEWLIREKLYLTTIPRSQCESGGGTSVPCTLCQASWFYVTIPQWYSITDIHYF